VHQQDIDQNYPYAREEEKKQQQPYISFKT
jgi:hypothetical protein